MKRSAATLSALGLALAVTLAGCSTSGTVGTGPTSNSVDIGRSGAVVCGVGTSFALFVPVVNDSQQDWTIDAVTAGVSRAADLQEGIVRPRAMGSDEVAGIPGDKVRAHFLTGQSEPDSYHPAVADMTGVKPGETVVAVVAAEGTATDRLAGFQGLTVTYTVDGQEKKITVDDAVWGAHPDISGMCENAPQKVTAG